MANYYTRASLDGFTLKIIAVVTMLIDHIGLIFFPQYPILRFIGRISFPIFAFLIAQGCYYTSNIKKYMLRMLIFAVITELFFDFAFYDKIYISHQNVLFTFTFAIIAIYIFNTYGRVAGYLGIVLFAIMADLLGTDYGAFGVMLVAIFYFTMGDFKLRMLSGTVFTLGFSLSFQRLCALAMIPIALYNGKRGRNIKYFFYIVYPGHLLILWLIKLIIH